MHFSIIIMHWKVSSGLRTLSVLMHHRVTQILQISCRTIVLYCIICVILIAQLLLNFQQIIYLSVLCPSFGMIYAFCINIADES